MPGKERVTDTYYSLPRYYGTQVLGQIATKRCSLWYNALSLGHAILLIMFSCHMSQYSNPYQRRKNQQSNINNQHQQSTSTTKQAQKVFA